MLEYVNILQDMIPEAVKLLQFSGFRLTRTHFFQKKGSRDTLYVILGG